MTDFKVKLEVNSVSNTVGIEEMESALEGVAKQSKEVADAAVSSNAKQVKSHRAIKAGVESISKQHPQTSTGCLSHTHTY